MSGDPNPPGAPPGDSAGPSGPGVRPYPLLIVLVLVLVLVAFLAIAIWAGAMSR